MLSLIFCPISEFRLIGSYWRSALWKQQIAVFNFNPAVTYRLELLGNPVVKHVITGVGNEAAFWNDISVPAKMG